VRNESLERLRNDVRERPDDVEAWFELTAAALDGGSLDEAREAIERVLGHAPDHPGAHRMLAVIQSQLGKTAEAIASWRRAVELSGGDDVEVLSRLGMALSTDGQHEEAVRILVEVAERRGIASVAQADLGMALLAAQRPNDALAAFRRACDLDRGSARAHCGLGLVFQRLGRWSEAAEAFRKTEELAPYDPVGPMNLAMVLRTLGEHGQARQALARAAALAPDNQELRQTLERLPMGQSEEEAARPTFPDQASIKGDLRTFGLLDVLEFLRVQGQSGTLMVSSDRGAGTVRLAQGRVLGAGAPGISPLGQILIERRLLDEGALRSAQAQIGGEDDHALAAHLWEEQTLDRARLGEAVLARIMAALGELLEWPAGDFSFHAAEEPPSALSFELQEITFRLAALRDEASSGAPS
jgi:Flp pilus assembly protein TadD